MAMSQWFRVYDELLDDPKVQLLPCPLFKFLINLWCVAKRHDGKLPSVETIAFEMHEPDVGSVGGSIEALERLGFIDRLSNQHGSWMAPHGWQKRQYKSDSSTARTRRHRAKQKDVPGNVPVAPPETENRKKESTSESVETPEYQISPQQIGVWFKEFSRIEVSKEVTNLQRWLKKNYKADPIAFIENALRKKQQAALERLKPEPEKPKTLVERMAEAKALDDAAARSQAVRDRLAEQARERRNGRHPPG